MKNAEEFMDDFMRTWKNMLKYQDVKLNPIQPNYDDFEKAFTEEKNIVDTQECNENQQISEIDDELER